MRAIHSLKAVAKAIAGRLAARSRPDFYCGQCERWQRCGLPPSEDCIHRLTQIENEGRSFGRNAAWWRARAASFGS
jgi:hypothetical protein